MYLGKKFINVGNDIIVRVTTYNYKKASVSFKPCDTASLIKEFGKEGKALLGKTNTLSKIDFDFYYSRLSKVLKRA